MQKTIKLSSTAARDFNEVANWKGLPLARLLSQYLEVVHQSDEFGRLLKRLRDERLTLTDEEIAQKAADFEDDED